jgi:hypothetical protein
MVTVVPQSSRSENRERAFLYAAQQYAARNASKAFAAQTNRPRLCVRTSPARDYATEPVAWARDVLGFHADETQQQVLAANSARGILNCTRQWGKTTICAIKALHYALFHPNSLVIVASPSLRQSGEFLRKARQAAAKLGIRPRGDGENRCSLLLPNGSRMVGLPESEGTVRGFSAVGLMIIDEASRVSDELYDALRPMLATTQNGALWLMSTPNGQSGFFYREWSSEMPWVRIRATAEECPRIPADFLRNEKLTMADDVYRREYCCEFVRGEGYLFDEADIRRRLTTRFAKLW